MEEDEDMDDTPVLIVPPGVEAGMRALVINLRNMLPPAGYQRVLEIVPAEETAREPARQRWLEYKQLGIELKRNEM
jgi:DNA polymerase-3 subunit chi